MNKIIYLIIIVLFVRCRTDTSESKNSKSDTLFNQSNTKKELKADTTITSNINNLSNKCNCENMTKSHYLLEDLRLNYHNSSLRKKDKDSLKYYMSSDSLINSVRSLQINTFKIPKELFVFKNLEQIKFSEIRGEVVSEIEGLENFSKLNSLILWGADVSIESIGSKAPNLKTLRIEKSRISHFDEIQNLSKLNSIYMSHSGLDNLPINWKNLTCLRHFIIVGHSFGIIDLNKINLYQLNCIEAIEITSNTNEVSGIPKGTGEKKLKKIRIRHSQLTNEEKNMIEASR